MALPTLVMVNDPATPMSIRISGVRDRHRHTNAMVITDAMMVMPIGPPRWVNAVRSCVLVAVRWANGLVQGWLVEAGDPVLFDHRVVDPRTRRGQPDDQRQAHRRGDVEHRVRRDVGRQDSHHSDQSTPDRSRPTGQVTAADVLLGGGVVGQLHRVHSSGRVDVLRGIRRQSWVVPGISVRLKARSSGAWPASFGRAPVRHSETPEFDRQIQTAKMKKDQWRSPITCRQSVLTITDIQRFRAMRIADASDTRCTRSRRRRRRQCQHVVLPGRPHNDSSAPLAVFREGRTGLRRQA